MSSRVFLARASPFYRAQLSSVSPSGVPVLAMSVLFSGLFLQFHQYDQGIHNLKTISQPFPHKHLSSPAPLYYVWAH